MSRALGCAAPTTPVTSQQDTMDQAFLEALSASDNESNKAGTHTGRHRDRHSGGPYIVESSKPLRVSQEGGAIEVETLPQPQDFTIYAQRDDTPLDNGDYSQELLTHQNAISGGLKGFQLPDEGSCCSTRSSMGYRTFDPFTHHLSSPHVERRPPYRYAMLIGMAILGANNQRLTLAQIYQWISDKFAYYSMEERGWQNSIRHNLSLNKNFVRIERSKHEPGKGHYWGIKPGQEHLFVPEERNGRRCRPGTDMDTGNLHLAHSSTDQPCPTSRVVVAPNTQQAARTPDLSYKMRQDCPDHITQSSCVTVQDSNLMREKGPQRGAFVQSPQTASKASRSPRKRGASPLWHRRHHRLETRSWPQVDSVVDDHRHDFPDITPIAHVDPARLMLQTGTKRSRFGEGRAETEIARIRKSCAKGPPNYGANTVPRATWATSSFSRVDPDFDAFHLPYGFDTLSDSSPSFSPKSILRSHRKSVRALLGSSSEPVSPSDEADA